MRRVLFSWIGATDVRLARSSQRGALASTLLEPSLALTETYLLRDVQPGEDCFDVDSLDQYIRWLQEQAPAARIVVHDARLESPMHFGQIFAASKAVLEQAGRGVEPTFNLSSGTPAMAAVWILLGRGTHPARLTNSSEKAGVVEATVPFDVYADFLPDLLRTSDRVLGAISAGPASGAFTDIIHRSPVMTDLIARAERVAPHDVPVLILGESGTGKELFANGIHRASRRAARPFQVVNCSAIPKDLVESTLFGHRKGSFTGADRDQSGVFEAANGGTLFLDEVGELPPATQAKLLRAVQEGEIQRVGETTTKKVDVRVIAATHRDLSAMVAEGSFRDDLYFRLAVAVIRVPPVRDRRGDLQILIEQLLERINRDASRVPGARSRRLSNGARRKLLEHSWPGNVRELQNTLLRATVWAAGDIIEASDVELLSVSKPDGADRILDRRFAEGFSVSEVIDEVRRHYLTRALKQAGGRKAEAARLLGLGRQSVADWAKQLEIAPVEEGET